MSSFWPKGKRGQGTGKKGALLLVLLLSLTPCLLCAGPYADLDAALAGKPEAQAVAGLRRIAGDDRDAQSALQAGPAAARAYVGLRAELEGAPATKPPPIAPSTGDERIASSWLARALSRIHWPKFDQPEFGGGPAIGIGAWATTLMWVVLAALGILAIYLLARYVRLPGRKGRKRIVDDDEPLRSADAWIEEADRLVAEGRYREAVRGLYVAGLMRFDEAGVARFDRNQTNWEHLRRIEASPKRPEDSDVRGATGRFDRCWYGHLPTTDGDAATMRAWYNGLVAKLVEAPQ